MNNFFKYLKSKFNKIDISPFAQRSFINLALYLFAGANVIIFTGKDAASQNYFYKDQIGQTVYSSVEKYTVNDFTIEKFELINPGGFIIFSSYSKLIVLSNSSKTPSGRGPP